MAAVLGLLLLLVAVPVREGAAQAPPPASSPPPPKVEAVVPAPPVFKMEEIDQLMAPIALYPDDLLAQILIAATYPLEIVMAARWVADPKNAALKGDALTQALRAQSWDPSVKPLVPFPAVLKMMSDHLEWTQQLGDAFLEQAQDCLASVQRLRQRAQSAGKLTSTPQQTVTTQDQAIIIAPADPDSSMCRPTTLPSSFRRHGAILVIGKENWPVPIPLRKIGDAFVRSTSAAQVQFDPGRKL